MTTCSKSGVRMWRDAASLILVSGHRLRPGVTPFNYSVLMAKRSSRSRFMPNAYVFPGGVCEPEDFMAEWRPLLHRVKSTDSLEPTDERAVPRPPMLCQASTGGLDLHLGFRINAIRETFEETGVLLTASRSDVVDNAALDHWQKLVRKDASQFFHMCQQLRLCPDVWALHEWSNWLTPTSPVSTKPQAARFDTMFYIALTTESNCVQLQPTVDVEAEVSDIRWSSPEDMLRRHSEQKLWLAPPQIFELSRMLNFGCASQLLEFSVFRSQHGCHRWLPLILPASDGRVSLLPQDCLYPDEQPALAGLSLDQWRQLDGTKNRLLLGPHSHQFHLDVNVVDPCHHKRPLPLV